VAAKKKTAKKRGPRSDAKNLKLVGVRLEDWQNKALNLEARQRAEATGSGVNDKSAIVREALDKHPDVKKHRP
jgi:hypothetical protein